MYLAHKSHKYTKKEYINGHWRYYYGYMPSRNPIERIADKIGKDEQVTYKQARKELGYRQDELDYRLRFKNDPEYQGANVQKVIDDGIEFTTEGLESSKKYVAECAERYYATPLGKLEIAADKAKNFIKKIFG